MDINELVELQKEVGELKSVKEKLTEENKISFDQKIQTIDEIGKYRRLLEETTLKLDKATKELADIEATMKEKLQSILNEREAALKIKNEAIREQEINAALIKKLEIDQEKIAQQQIENKEVSIKNANLSEEVRTLRDQLIADMNKVQDKIDQLEKERTECRLNNAQALHNLEVLKNRQSEVDTALIESKYAKDETVQLNTTLSRKIKVVNEQADDLNKLKQEVLLKIKDLEDAKLLAEKEKQFYVNRLNELEAEKQQIHLTELKVQKLIKDHQLKDEIKALEESSSRK
jgi:chromosome segregation ATPase